MPQGEESCCERDADQQLLATARAASASSANKQVCLKVCTMHSGSFNPVRWLIQVPDIGGLSIETQQLKTFLDYLNERAEQISTWKKSWLNSGQCRCSTMSIPDSPALVACCNAAGGQTMTCTVLVSFICFPSTTTSILVLK